jgi:hypothetical protein
MRQTVPTSTYREHPPSARLARHVLCVWLQAIGAGETLHRHRVLPDGCADVVWIGETPAVVAGPATGPIIVPLRPRTIVVGIRLRPGAASGALGLPASGLLDRDTLLRDLWGPGADALSAVALQPSSAARLAAAEAALARRLGDAGPVDPAIAAEVGYADQADMSRELQALTGRSPRGLLQSRASTLELSDLFKTEATPEA